MIHSGLVMRGGETYGAVLDGDRDQVLHADVRHGAVVYDVHAVVRHGDADAAHTRGLHAVLGQQRRGRVEHCLDWRADAPFFYRGTHDFEARAKLVHKLARLRLVPEGGVEIIAAGEWVLHGRETRRYHQGAGDAVARSHAAEVERLLDMLAVAVPVRHPGRLLNRVGKDVPYLLGIEA